MVILQWKLLNNDIFLDDFDNKNKFLRQFVRSYDMRIEPLTKLQPQTIHSRDKL